ncbi:MAG: amidohydrolase [Saprospirales bacterium]|nr:MAG: amidohydrolase [Saprospirales bacterium]
MCKNFPDIEALIEFRRELHRYPEISGEEEETSKRVLKYLQKLEPTKIVEFNKYGLAAIFDSGKKGPSVLLRADLDALPIQESNKFKHRSKVEGVSHKCGHDGHSTILCGVGDWLTKNKPQKGRVILLFQPAEETGEGAQWMLDDRKFQKIEPDIVFALHNLPRFPMHSIVHRTGTFTAAVISMVVKFRGKTAHAGQPDNGINPATAIAELLLESNKLTHNEPADEDFKLVTPIFATLGKHAYGTSAGNGEVHFTIRAWTTERMRTVARKMRDKARELAKRDGLDCKIKWIQEFISNVNGEKSVDSILSAAKENNLKTIEVDRPFRWGEDFGRLSSKYKGAMFGLGAGENTPDLHNPDYDFPDELIEKGIRMFSSILRQYNY